MIAKSEIAKIYETILAIPGMNEEIKLSLKTTRKNILLLSKIIDRGMNTKEMDEGSLSVLELISKETLQELSAIAPEILQKAGLTEMNERLKSF